MDQGQMKQSRESSVVAIEKGDYSRLTYLYIYTKSTDKITQMCANILLYE